MLANVVRKPLRQIFSEFAGVTPESGGGEWSGTGDVKYHLGTSYDRPTTSGKRVHLSLLANPSHLEVSMISWPLAALARIQNSGQVDALVRLHPLQRYVGPGFGPAIGFWVSRIWCTGQETRMSAVAINNSFVVVDGIHVWDQAGVFLAPWMHGHLNHPGPICINESCISLHNLCLVVPLEGNQQWHACLEKMEPRCTQFDACSGPQDMTRLRGF